MMENKTSEQLKQEAKATKQDLRESRALKVKGMRDLNNAIYTFIYETYKWDKVPVDKFGHFYSRGGQTVEDQVSPDFSDIDFILALNLENNKLLKEVRDLLKKLTKDLRK